MVEGEEDLGVVVSGEDVANGLFGMMTNLMSGLVNERRSVARTKKKRTRR